jgi:hypothetical protein
MPGLTSPFLPDDLNDEIEFTEDNLEVVNVKTDDEISLTTHKAQNDPDDGVEPEGDGGDGEGDSDDALQRERNLRFEAEKRWLKEQEASDAALLNSEKTKLKVQNDAFKLSIDNCDVRLRTCQEALKLARQDNDIGAATDIEGEMQQLRTLKTQIEANMAKLPSEEQLDNLFKEHIGKRRQRVQAETAGDDAAKPLTPKAGKWAKANASWFGKNDVAMKAAMAINDSLVAEGYDANKDEFFVELTRRMQRALPKLGVKDVAGRAQPTQRATSNSSAPPVAGGRTASPGSHAPGAGKPVGDKFRVNLGPSDRTMMKNLRLDPNNKTHVDSYVAERAKTLRAEQRKGA